MNAIVMWEKTSVDGVWKLPDGNFMWSDETEQLHPQVFENFDDAVSAQNFYIWFILEGLGERLQTEQLEVTFKKSDGTLRTMFCTSSPSAFPVREQTERTKAPNTDVQVVWDLEKNAIRSFRKDSVVSVAQRK